MSVLLLGQLESSVRFRVVTQYYQPNTLDQSIISSGHLVDSIPLDVPQQDKSSTLYFNPVTSELWYEYTPIVSSEIQRIQELQDAAKTADQKYKELNITTANLVDVQNAKVAQLNDACNKTITNGFDYTVSGVSYHFSCSLNAQQNFTGTKIRMDAGKDTSKAWTAINNTTGKIERVTLSVTDINSITDIIDDLVSTNISKFRDTLEPTVWAATTNAAVDAINW